MSEIYQVLGAGVPAMLGRAVQIRDITSRIQNNHLQVVGAKYFGKTVLLNALKTHPFIGQSFGEIVYWDLSAHTPKSDAEFWVSFSHQLQNSFSSARIPYAAKLKDQPQLAYNAFESLSKGLRADKINVLVLMNGMESLLVPRYVTRDLLDNLRDLGQLGSFKFVTASRKTLREISPPEIKTSPFLNLLNTIVWLNAFDEDDWKAFLQPLQDKGFALDPTAVAELKSVTGGVPILAAAACRELINFPSASAMDSAPISRAEIAAAIQKCESGYCEIIAELWRECGAELQAIITEVARLGKLSKDKVRAGHFQILAQRGYCHHIEHNIVSSCRMMDNYALRNGNVVPDIQRLFGTKLDYDNNIKPLLEMRLSQLSGLDPDLRDYVEMAIRELQKPHVCMAQFRSVVTRALQLIWDAELPDRMIPVAWTNSWQKDGAKNPPSGRLGSPTQQCRVLDMLTDGRNSLRPKKINRQTYLLTNFMQEIGDYGQHIDGVPQPDFALCACVSAIELCDNLANRLTK